MTDQERIRSLEERLIALEAQQRRKRWYVIAAIVLLPAGLWAATTLPHTFKDGDTLTAAQLNDNFQALANASVVPVGTVVAYGGSSAPSGWLLCDGAQVSRSTYATLYSAIGNAFGSGDGSSSFHLPDFRGRFLRGVDGSANVDPDKATRTAMNGGGNAGNQVGSLQGHQLNSHNHIVPDAEFAGDGFTTFELGNTNTPVYGNRTTQNTGGNETRPVNAYINYVIKY